MIHVQAETLYMLKYLNTKIIFCFTWWKELCKVCISYYKKIAWSCGNFIRCVYLILRLLLCERFWYFILSSSNTTWTNQCKQYKFQKFDIVLELTKSITWWHHIHYLCWRSYRWQGNKLYSLTNLKKSWCVLRYKCICMMFLYYNSKFSWSWLKLVINL